MDENSVKEATFKVSGDISDWHYYRLITAECGNLVWRCARCGRREPYICMGLAPQSDTICYVNLKSEDDV